MKISIWDCMLTGVPSRLGSLVLGLDTVEWH